MKRQARALTEEVSENELMGKKKAQRSQTQNPSQGKKDKKPRLGKDQMADEVARDSSFIGISCVKAIEKGERK